MHKSKLLQVLAKMSLYHFYKVTKWQAWFFITQINEVLVRGETQLNGTSGGNKSVGATALPRLIPRGLGEIGHCNSACLSEIKDTQAVVFNHEKEGGAIPTVLHWSSIDNLMVARKGRRSCCFDEFQFSRD